MDDDIFDDEEEWIAQLRGKRCTCGQGWCPYHGTDHLSDDEERIAAEMRETISHRGTHGGCRVIRKRIGEEG